MGKTFLPGLLTAVLLSLGCSKSNSGKIDLTSDLAGRWPLGTNITGVMAPLQANLTGGVSLVSTEIGPSYRFDGSSGAAVVGDAPEFQFRSGQDFSILAWIQPEISETSFGVMSIVEKRKIGGIATALGYSLHLEYGKIACQITTAPGFHFKFSDLFPPKKLLADWHARKQLQLVSRFVAPQPDLRDGQFHFVALTIERDSMSGGKFYVDGRVVLTFDPTKLRGSLVNSEPLMLGTHPDSSLHCAFKGQIGGVRLYRRALSSAEIEAACKVKRGS